MSEVAKRHGVSDVTIYAWRKRFGRLEAGDVKRLHQVSLIGVKEPGLFGVMAPTLRA